MEENSAVGQIDPANLPKIYLMVGIVAAYIAIAYFLGKKGADKAEAKGHQRFFGFLLCFYFGPLGFWILNRLETNYAELARREREAVEVEKPDEQTEALDPFDADMRQVVAALDEGRVFDAASLAGGAAGAQLKGEVEGTRQKKKIDLVPRTLSFAGRKPNWTAIYILMGLTLVGTIFLRFRPEDYVASVDVRTIPTTKPGWTYLGDAPDTDTSKKQMEEIKADSYVMRYYRAPNGNEVELYVVYRRYGRREFNHNPDNCFPAGGWQLMKRGVANLYYAGKEHEVEHMLFDGSGVVRADKDPTTGNQRVGLPPATVTYFFASGDRTEHVFLKQQLWMALERLIPNKNGWALVRLTTIRKTTDDDALQTQKDFMRAFGDDIARTITTDAEHAHLPTVASANP